MELMATLPQAWYWLIFGILLAITELFVPSFVCLWLAIAAALVGGVVWIWPEVSLSVQLVIWMVLSVALTVFWFKIFKVYFLPDRTSAGLSLESVINEVGLVIAVGAQNEARVRFPAPLLGEDEWPVLSQDTLVSGQKVVVTAVRGNRLVVKPAE